MLADVLRTDRRRLVALTPDGSATVGLRMLVRARKDLVAARIAAHNQLRSHLLSAFPGAVGLFAALDSPISLTLLTRFPSAQRARWLSVKRLAAWLGSVGSVGYCGRQPAVELMSHLQQAPGGMTGPAAEAAEVVTEQLVALLRTAPVARTAVLAQFSARPRSSRSTDSAGTAHGPDCGPAQTSPPA